MKISFLDPTATDTPHESGLTRVWRWKDEALPIIFLHGFGGSGLDAEAWLHSLPTPPHVIAPDLIGHGGTRVSEGSGYGISDCVDDLGRLLDAMDVKRFVLMGYSMGGRVALDWARESPPGLAALVIIGAHPGLRDPTEREERRIWDAQMAEKARELGAQAFMSLWSDLPILSTQDRIAEPWRSRMRARREQGDAEGWARSLEAAGSGSMLPLWDSLSNIEVPTLLVVGEEDRKYRAVAEEMVEKMAFAKTVWVEGAGHSAHAENPDAFAKALIPFLNGL